MKGRTEGAAALIRRAIDNATGMQERAALLSVGVEIPTTAGAIEEAAELCAEMSDIARVFGTEIIAASPINAAASWHWRKAMTGPPSPSSTGLAAIG